MKANFFYRYNNILVINYKPVHRVIQFYILGDEVILANLQRLNWNHFIKKTFQVARMTNSKLTMKQRSKAN